MAVAILFPFRKNNTLFMRGNVGAGGVSIFWPVRIGNSRVWRGKACNGKVLYAWPFRHGNTIFCRTQFISCTTGGSCCQSPNCITGGTQAQCEAAGGVWYENYDDCIAACPQVKRPCCVGTNCTIETEGDCLSKGGVWQWWWPDGTTCADVVCVPQYPVCACFFAPPATQYLKVTLQGITGTRTGWVYDCIGNNICTAQAMNYSAYNGTYYVKLSNNTVCEGTVPPNKFRNGQYVWAPKVIPNPLSLPHCPPPDASNVNITWGLRAGFRTSAPGKVVAYAQFDPHVPFNRENRAWDWESAAADCIAGSLPLLANPIGTGFYNDPSVIPCGGTQLVNSNRGTVLIEFAQSVPKIWYDYLNL